MVISSIFNQNENVVNLVIGYDGIKRSNPGLGKE